MVGRQGCKHFVGEIDQKITTHLCLMAQIRIFARFKGIEKSTLSCGYSYGEGSVRKTFLKKVIDV